MAKSLSFAALAAVLATQVSAQVNPWGQCGGMYYNGPTTCVSGWTCVYQNDWYSQCLQGSGPTSTTRTSSTSTRTSSTSTRSSTSSTTTTRSSSTSSTSTSSSSVSTTSTRTSSSSASSGSPAPTGNPYAEGREIWLSPYYAAEVDAAAAAISDSTLKAKALKVKSIPTFTWFDVVAKVPILGDYLADAYSKEVSTGKKQLVQIVVYDLPNRDCHANASNGEFFFNQDGANKYKAYIDGLAAHIAQYPSVRVVAVIEPDSLANLVTNLSDPRCQAAESGYKSSTIYAIQKLSAAGAVMYLDAGHAGWLGWPANITPAAQLFADLFTAAGKPSGVRGLATNVSNYNALRAASPDPVTPPNPNYDEIHYIDALGPMLESRGFPAHFIVDQGRSGVQNIRSQWGNWCNIKGAGFGTRPTTSTGSSYIDAIVWIKPGGEADGTSNTSAPRYDSMCGGPDAHVPAPEAGTWFQAYFENLVKNANPAL